MIHGTVKNLGGTISMKLLFNITLSLIFLAGCSVPRPNPNIYSIDPDSSIIALVLGEGIARSYAHVGVIKALEEEEIPLHLVVGSGTGALMAALYANKKSANDLEWHAMNFKKETYMNFKIDRFLTQRLVHSKIEDGPIPLVIVTTDLKTGTPFLIDKGPISKAVQASLVIPGFFEPISYGDKTLVSGEISNGLPVDVAIHRGADLIIAVDLMQGIESYAFRREKDITLQSYKITSSALTKKQLTQAHLVIQPEVSKIDFFDFSRKREAMLAGYDATKKMIPEIRKILNLQEKD